MAMGVSRAWAEVRSGGYYSTVMYIRCYRNLRMFMFRGFAAIESEIFRFRLQRFDCCAGKILDTLVEYVKRLYCTPPLKQREWRNVTTYHKTSPALPSAFENNAFLITSAFPPIIRQSYCKHPLYKRGTISGNSGAGIHKRIKPHFQKWLQLKSTLSFRSKDELL